MQPDKKQTKIVLASILKPLDDVRHFEKLGRSLAKNPAYEIHLLGRETNYQIENNEKLFIFFPLVSALPSSFERLLAPCKMLVYLIKVKPKQVVACTHELLIVILLNKILFGTKTVYDVQENYAENIRSNTRFGTLAKTLLAGYIRTKEKLCAPFIDQFWLAEACYEQELPFVKGKSIKLEFKILRTQNSFVKINKPTGSCTFWFDISQACQFYFFVKTHDRIFQRFCFKHISFRNIGYIGCVRSHAWKFYTIRYGLVCKDSYTNGRIWQEGEQFTLRALRIHTPRTVRHRESQGDQVLW